MNTLLAAATHPRADGIVIAVTLLNTLLLILIALGVLPPP